MASFAEEASWNRTRAVPYVPLDVRGLYSTDTYELEVLISCTYNLAIAFETLQQRDGGLLLLDETTNKDGSVVNVPRLAIDDLFTQNTTTVR